MSAPYSPLADLVRLLSTMPQADRDFVLAGLSESECAMLLPLLTPAGDSLLSPTLKTLVRRCEAGATDELTSRSAEALAAAARESRADSPMKPYQPAGPRGWWSRLVGRAAL